MASLLDTVENLVEEIRAMLDEDNVDSVDTDRDIIPSLNRAQDYAFDILSRKYEEPILAEGSLTLIANQADYDIPENVFEDKVQKIDIITATGISPTYIPIQRISYRDISDYESQGPSPTPQYYCIIGRTIRLIPTPTGTYNARMWYLRNPEKLVQPQGRLTIVNNTSNYVVVDSAGSLLTTEADQLGSYVNLINGRTGEIKGTLQIQVLSENKLTFRSTPARSTVLNRTVSGSLSSLVAVQDDYIAPVEGTCVPYYGKPVRNFLIQFAVAEITRKLGGAADTEERILEKFEKQVERNWVGRENQLRIKKKNGAWRPSINRWRNYNGA